MNKTICAKRRLLLLSVWLALLASCTTIPSHQAEKKPPNVNLSGYPPAFRDGYLDGCASVGALMRKRDDERYKSDAQYKQGWGDGYSICKSQKK